MGDLKYFKELFAEHRALSGMIPGKLFLTETDRKSRSVSFTTSVNYPQHHLFRIAHPSRACDDEVPVGTPGQNSLTSQPSGGAVNELAAFLLAFKVRDKDRAMVRWGGYTEMKSRTWSLAAGVRALWIELCKTE